MKLTCSINKERDRIKPWIEKTLKPRFPELEATLMAAVDAFDSAQEASQFLPQQLNLIVEAASSPRRPLYVNVTSYLAALAARWPEANVAILEMSRSRKAHVRFNAILCLDKSTPATTVEQVLKSSLTDKSARVRAKAADWMGRLRKVEFVSELAAALAKEQDSKTRSTMNSELRLLRDGFILEPAQGGGYNVTVFSNDGGMRGQQVGEGQLQSQGIEAIAEELRSKQF